jgi:hypothetical protein
MMEVSTFIATRRFAGADSLAVWEERKKEKKNKR